VPTDYGFGCDDGEGVLPIRPDSPGDYQKSLSMRLRLGRGCRRFSATSC
jgi:hypothetical protein